MKSQSPVRRVSWSILLIAAMTLAGSGCTFQTKPHVHYAKLPDTPGCVPYEYAVLLPHVPAPAEGWPLILTLHGSAPRTFTVQKAADDALSNAFSKPGFPFLVVAPCSPSGRRLWDPNSLNLILTEVCSKYPVDRRRIYCTGQSLGGYGTWYMAATYPDWFAAIAPICGGFDPSQVQDLKNIPAWIFHGWQDPRVPPSKAVEMANALKAAGDNVRLTIYGDEGHQVWYRVHREGQVFDWFLQHRRATPATRPVAHPTTAPTLPGPSSRP